MTMSCDKDAEWLGQSGSDRRNDFFDQYLTFDTIDIKDSAFLVAPESTVLAKSNSGGDSVGTSSSVWENETRHNLKQLSRGEPAEHQKPASVQATPAGSTSTFDRSAGAVGSEPELLSLKGISLQSPRVSRVTQSPPSSPKSSIAGSLRGRSRFLQRFPKSFRKETENSGLRKLSPIRKPTSPAKMMHMSPYNQQHLHDLELRLALDASKFDFGFQNNLRPLSPPPSARPSEASDAGNNMIARTVYHDGAFTSDHPLPQQYACRGQADLNTALITPPLDITTFNQSNFQDICSNNMVYASSHRNHATASWDQTPITSEYTLDSSTAFVQEEESAPVWWGHASTTPLAQPCPSAFQRPIHHTTKSLAMQLQAELAYNANELALSPSNMPSGLMIQLPQSPVQQSFVVEPSPMSKPQGYFALTAAASCPPQPHPQRRYTESQAQPQPPPQQYASPKTRRGKSLSRSRSSPSPSLRSRASSFHVVRRRSASATRKRASQQTRARKSSKSGSGGGSGTVDFVNFTPDDSMKILTGVAPSGSSKTKARREKEAMEKTRRLSQAAVRAVQAAGGSIASLVEEGLFVPPN